jgi:hypothetical protein
MVHYRGINMRRLLWAALAAVAFWGSLATEPLSAQTPGRPAGDVRIASLISRLGSSSYADRRAANDELAMMGAETRQQLEVAARDADPEVRLRAKALLIRLKVLDLWSAGRVTCEAKSLPASKLLATIAEQTGNHILMGDQYGSFHDQTLELKEPTGDFWQVMDEVCRQSANRMRPHYDTRQPGLVVVAGEPGKFPVAYSGPVRSQINSARRVFTEELDYEDLDSELTHTFQLNLQMMWEDRFKLVAYRSQPELTVARTNTGIELSATQPSGSGWNVAGSGTRQLTMSLRLHPPATTAKELDTLSLKWGLIAVGDMATLEVSNLTSPEPHFQDDVELVVESVQSGPGSRQEVSLRMTRDLVVPEPQEVLFQENDVELLDAQGRAFRKQGQTNNLTETGARMKVTFIGESSDSVPKTLRFIYPRIRAQKDVELVFRHVPLPSAKPE